MSSHLMATSGEHQWQAFCCGWTQIGVLQAGLCPGTTPQRLHRASRVAERPQDPKAGPDGPAGPACTAGTVRLCAAAGHTEITPRASRRAAKGGERRRRRGRAQRHSRAHSWGLHIWDGHGRLVQLRGHLLPQQRGIHGACGP